MSVATSLPPAVTPALPSEAALDSLYEVIDGRRVEKPPMGAFECVVNSILDQTLGAHVRANRLGRVVPEALFKINPAGNPQRRPDLAFVSYERWPRERKITSEDAWNVVPDLAIEVVSPNNKASEVLEKTGEYFRAGVRRVWIVYPIPRQVHVFSSPKQSRILGPGDSLDGEDLLPGFRLSLDELFEDGAEA